MSGPYKFKRKNMFYNKKESGKALQKLIKGKLLEGPK